MTDILKRLTEDLARTFQRDDDGTPEHLVPIEPATAVHALVDEIAVQVPHEQVHIFMELSAFRETRTPHDAARVISALKHTPGLEGLAAKVQALLEGAAP